VIGTCVIIYFASDDILERYGFTRAITTTKASDRSSQTPQPPPFQQIATDNQEVDIISVQDAQQQGENDEADAGKGKGQDAPFFP
jgi:hypothetical protein